MTTRYSFDKHARAAAAAPAASTRVYASHAQQGNGPAAQNVAPATSATDLIGTLVAQRKLARDLHQIGQDPSVLEGYHDLPASVQQMAAVDPLSFWAMWQLAQAGVDLHAMEALEQGIQRDVDEALRACGWDGTTPPTDEQLATAEKTVRQRLSGENST